jgi:hypothetical protein
MRAMPVKSQLATLKDESAVVVASSAMPHANFLRVMRAINMSMPRSTKVDAKQGA